MCIRDSANGGTYNFVLTYRGNGPSPLTAISDTPGNNYTYFGLSAGSFMTSLTETNGPTIEFYDLNFYYNFLPSATCTLVGPPCNVGQIGLTPGATMTGPINGTWATAVSYTHLSSRASRAGALRCWTACRRFRRDSRRLESRSTIAGTSWRRISTIAGCGR